MNFNLEPMMQTCAALGIKPAERVIVVDIATQLLRFYTQGRLVSSQVISTSARPPSNVKDSLGTPRGLHAIAERIGAGQPAGIVFKARVPTGKHHSEYPAGGDTGNLITTRILWLKGLEPGVNSGGDVDTYSRYIYIHGTNHEDRLGTPMSSGCVLMSDRELITLYEQVRVGDLVWIQ